MEIKRIVFLIHPLVYEGIAPEVVRDRNYAIFVEREREVKSKWLEDAASATGTLVLQLYGLKSLHSSLAERMGPAWVCYVHAEYTDGMPQAEYDARLVACIRNHMAEHRLTFDPATATSEIWGESFEGCAPDYASAFAVGLGLKTPPKMRFEMTAYDSRFLKDAKVLEIIPIRAVPAIVSGTGVPETTNSDVEAVLFELYDETFAAMYQTRLTPQRLDNRVITVSLDPTRTQVCTKLGHTVWPPKPWQKGDPPVNVPYQLETRDYYWVRGITISQEEFRGLVASAVVAQTDSGPPAAL